MEKQYQTITNRPTIYSKRNNYRRYLCFNEEPQKVTLKEDEITSITFENEKKKGQIKVIKIDGETEVPLEGVTFIVENSKGEIVDRIITDENGEGTSERLAIDEQYTVYEEKTKKGYILSNEKQVVELKENEITDLKFDNYKEKGKIKNNKSIIRWK